MFEKHVQFAELQLQARASCMQIQALGNMKLLAEKSERELKKESKPERKN